MKLQHQHVNTGDNTVSHIIPRKESGILKSLHTSCLFFFFNENFNYVFKNFTTYTKSKRIVGIVLKAYYKNASLFLSSFVSSFRQYCETPKHKKTIFSVMLAVYYMSKCRSEVYTSSQHPTKWLCCGFYNLSPRYWCVQQIKAQATIQQILLILSQPNASKSHILLDLKKKKNPELFSYIKLSEN